MKKERLRGWQSSNNFALKFEIEKKNSLDKCYKTFNARNMQMFCNKLECLSLASLTNLALFVSLAV